MTLLIAGSRTFKNMDLVVDLINSISQIDPEMKIITGGAVGVDDMAKTCAEEMNLETETFFPDWDKFGKRAGIVRNEEMVKVADKVCVFWDGTSRGTKSTIDFALKHKKDLQVFFDEDTVSH